MTASLQTPRLARPVVDLSVAIVNYRSLALLQSC